MQNSALLENKLYHLVIEKDDQNLIRYNFTLIVKLFVSIEMIGKIVDTNDLEFLCIFNFCVLGLFLFIYFFSNDHVFVHITKVDTTFN